MIKRGQFYSTTNLLSTMEDTNAFEINIPGVLEIMKKEFPDEIVDMIVISVKIGTDWKEVVSIYPNS